MEPMFPEQTYIWVHLVISVTVEALEKMWAWIAFFHFNARGLVFLFTLQHHPNCQWFSDLWGPLHLMHLELWEWHDIVACPYCQQFLYWGMPGFILAPWIVAIYLPMLKHLLIRHLALLPLWTSQISIQMIDISDLGETLITHGLDVRTMLLKIWFCLMIPSTSLGVRYSLDESWGR